MAEITDRRSIGVSRDDVAAALTAHPGDLPGVRASLLTSFPNLDEDYIYVEGGTKVLLIDYILDDVDSYL